jgi:lysozyme family protein
MARGQRRHAQFQKFEMAAGGPPFRPGEDYFSIWLRAVHIPAKGLGTSRFAPVIWSTVRAHAGAPALLGVFPPASEEGRPDFARGDRITVSNLRLTPPLVAPEQIAFDLTLGSMKEKDFLAGALGLVSELAATPAAAFISQLAPVVGAAQHAVQFADRIAQGLGALMDDDKLKAVGQYVATLQPPLRSGLVAFTDAQVAAKDLAFDEAANMLTAAGRPLKSAWAVVEFRRDETRPDWQALPDVNAAWARIRQTALEQGDILAAIEFFRVTVLTSPDLTRVDADRLVSAAMQKFAPVMAESEGAETVEDPGEIGPALQFFIDAQREAAEAESAVLGAGVSVAGAAVAATPFARALAMVLEHEGGFVDHPDDPGGATNRGVTQANYDAYRDRIGQPRRSVRELEDGELNEIYFHGYWRAARCDEMPNEAVAVLMFDAAVNHGPAQAIKLLQQAAGAPAMHVDGKYGPNTRARVTAAARETARLVDACLIAREEFYRRLVRANPRLNAFIRGWMNRLASVRRHVEPLVSPTAAPHDAESALLLDDGARERLVAAPPEFGDWRPAGAPAAAAPVA